ncbi:MAG TPA: ATP-dependent helicase [Candidatus Dormibacteraeota bacterium]|nr:ATP-dependent helicase [Candidatus Dormibacteraeota bacterium]
MNTGQVAPYARMTVALDPDQLQAVEHLDGPCLVLAGPGSGKTRVIVERFLRLLDQGVGPDQQLVLTYTRKAADEMRARAEEAHGPFSGDPPLTNYHAFGYSVVRDWGWLVGIAPVFRIADAAERWLHAEAVLDELRPRTLWNPLRPHDLMDPLLAVIGYAKQELVTPDAYATWAQERLGRDVDPATRAVLERHAEVAAVYAALDERYRRLAVFDHDDCILYAERLIREHPAARHAVAGRIRYVMVDEYQDTNFAQARLVETLTRDHHNVLVVADDDQSIYKFRGASRANLDRFTREHPGHRSIVLTHNYRSTPQIVRASRAVIATAAPATRIPKELVAERGAGAAVEVWAAPD